MNSDLQILLGFAAVLAAVMIPIAYMGTASLNQETELKKICIEHKGEWRNKVCSFVQKAEDRK